MKHVVSARPALKSELGMLLDLRGEHPLIDLDAAPFIPAGCEIVEHVKGGQLKWDPKKIQFHLEREQLADQVLNGHELYSRLKDKKPFNANLLDFFLAHPRFIPEEYKVGPHGETSWHIRFFGTKYRSSLGNTYIRFLFWDTDQWCWDFLDLDQNRIDRRPAVIPAS